MDSDDSSTEEFTGFRIDVPNAGAEGVQDEALAKESGIDLAFDALMSLDENKDLSSFMRSDSVDLLWNVNVIKVGAAKGSERQRLRQRSI